MAFEALIGADRVRVDVIARSKKHALEMAADLLCAAYEDLSVKVVFNALVAREKLGCTSLGHGVALPHASIDLVETGTAAALRLKQPLSFGDDGAPVSLIIALIIPGSGQGANNDLLQLACDRLSEGDFRRQLMQAETADQLHAALRGGNPAERVHEAAG